MNSQDVLKVWFDIQKEHQVGISRRLIQPGTPFHICLTYKYPNDYYGVGFFINKDIKLNLDSFSLLKDLKVEVIPNQGFDGSSMLLVQLLTSEYKDIFASLCDNLIHSVINITDEKRRIKTVVNQLERWKSMFDRLTSEGLTLSEQKGLFGELSFLQKILCKTKLEAFEVIDLWVGVDYDSVDFKGATWAIEVKTTTSLNSEEVKISNEKQLDDTNFANLYLYHLALNDSKSEGDSLLGKVNDIRNFLAGDEISLNLFKSKLFQVGFFDKHEHLYNDHFYKIREENIYRVGAAFPRIKQNELRDGVSRVTYYINIANCNEYLVSESQVLSKIVE